MQRPSVFNSLPPPLDISTKHALMRVVLGAGLLAFLALIIAAGVIWLQASQLKSVYLSRVTLFAKAIDGQTTRVLEGSRILVKAVADLLADDFDPIRLGPQLASDLRTHPYIRSISVVDTKGRVLASSSDLNVDRMVDLQLLGLSADLSREETIGTLLAGRDINELEPIQSSVLRANAIPIVAAVRGFDKKILYVVALVNPGYFSSQHELLLEDPQTRAMLANFQGTLFSASSNVAAPLSTSLSSLEIFTAYLPKREFGTYIGRGVDGNKVVTAFRVSRMWPLVTIVEVPFQEVESGIVSRSLGVVGVLVAAWVLIAALCITTWRSVRRDISARDAMSSLHRKIAESEARKAAVLASAADCLITVNGAGVIAEFNPAAETVFRLSADKAIGRPLVDVISNPDNANALSQALSRVSRVGGGQIQRFDFDARRSNGVDFAAEITVTASGDRRGGLLFLALRDVDEDRRQRRQLEEARAAIALSDARRLAVMDTSLDAVVMIDQNGCVVDFNPAAERMFGYQHAAVRGADIADLIIPKQYREAHRKGMARYLESGEGTVLNKRIEIIALRSNGEEFPVELAIVPVNTVNAIYFTATLRDISGRLREDAARARILVQHRKVASVLKRLKAAIDQHAIVSIYNHSGELIYGNKKFQKVFGSDLKRLLGQPLDAYKADNSQDGIYENVRNLLSLGRVWHGELTKKTQGGDLCWLASTVVPVPAKDGLTTELIVIQTDVSDLKRAELALARLHARELEIGSRIQKSLLVALPPTHVQGLWGTAYAQASQGIDGDFVEMIQLNEHCVDIVVGDVMGKGVPAALLGAATKLQINRSISEMLARSTVQSGLPEPHEIVLSVHKAMTPHLQALESFVTLCYLRIDTQENTLRWVGCGHEEPLVISSDAAMTSLPNHHPPMGVLNHEFFEQGQTRFMVRDRLFLCSDGVSDALTGIGERLGRDAVHEMILRRAQLQQTPGSILHGFRRELLDQRLRYTDDLTLVIFERKAMNTQAERMEVDITLDALPKVRQFVEKAAVALPLDRSALLAVAFIEVFTNTVRHALGLLEFAPVELISYVESGALILEQVHLGDAFDPPNRNDPPDLDEFPEGGFGMSIIYAACDHVQYSHLSGVNTVRLTTMLTVNDDAV